jgi:hypothetical protein
MPLLIANGYGAPPAGLNWWEGNRFMMPSLLMPEAPPPPAPASPAAPVAPSISNAASWVPDARAWTGDGGGMQGGASGIMDQRLGTSENPGVTRSSWDMAKETGGMLGRAALGALNPFGGWGSALGTLAGLGLGLPGLGTIGGMFDMARDVTAAFGRSPMGQTTYDAFGNVVSAPSGMSRSELDAMNDVVSRGQEGWNAMSADRQQSLDRAIADAIAANPDIFGMGGGTEAQAGTAQVDRSVGDVFGAGYDAGTGMGGMSGPDGGTYGWAKGGQIHGGAVGRSRGLLDVDPPGPDNAYAPVQTGEGVVTRAAMRRHPGLLAAWNRGDTPAMRRLLRAT